MVGFLGGRPGLDVTVAKSLDQVPGALVEDLEIRVFAVASGTQDPARCIIDARGNHLLTTTVRNPGTRPVPIHSPQPGLTGRGG
ncbi:hypothetical protein [Kribbella albertanoniae]|uniref:Uncharacterized protein n=1 Tax=Kribbella albertanoniae TaxID=1266829 RepID=A0A4R4QJU5_9ACTN|nr:hypothetical protein [Kribbella albertanoniae]TDC35492.1 hypothetical protein E1261_01105 [Kribbella albertanoniae]